METKEILRQLGGIKAQARVSIASNQLVLENATKLERRIEQEQDPFQGSARRKVSEEAEAKMDRKLAIRRKHYLKKMK